MISKKDAQQTIQLVENNTFVRQNENADGEIEETD